LLGRSRRLLIEGIVASPEYGVNPTFVSPAAK
jgi:hypothetical protein